MARNALKVLKRKTEVAEEKRLAETYEPPSGCCIFSGNCTNCGKARRDHFTEQLRCNAQISQGALGFGPVSRPGAKVAAEAAPVDAGLWHPLSSSLCATIFLMLLLLELMLLLLDVCIV